MARRSSQHRNRRTLPAFPVSQRPGRHSRATYRRPFELQRIQPQRQPHAVSRRRRQRIRERRTGERIGRHSVRNPHGAVLCPHWERGYPGTFWWRLN